MFRKQKLLKGFALVEILVVIATIAILVLVAVTLLSPGRAKARDSKRVTEVNSIRKAIQTYYLEHGEYPEQDDTWCSIELDCTNLVEKITSYLPEIPGDPLYGKGKEESAERIYSYRYVTTRGGSEYRIRTDLERGDYYEVHSMFGKEIAYVPPDGGNGNGNGSPGPAGWCISTSSSAFEFDPGSGSYPAIFQIDSTHYLVAYKGSASDGWSVVLEVDGNWNISTSSSAFEFDPGSGSYPAISQIDSTHYLVAYTGLDGDGWSVVLEVDGSWNISIPASTFEFDPVYGGDPAISQIDSTHYLVVYSGPDIVDGWSVVLEVDGSWNISTSSGAFEFDLDYLLAPSLSQIDSTHYLVAYTGLDGDGWSVVLEVDGSWNISTSSSAFEFDPNYCGWPAISQIDSTHYLVAYRAVFGYAVVLGIDTLTWTISKAGSTFKFTAGWGDFPAISQIDSTHYLVAYTGLDGDGWSVVLEVDGSWNISTSSSAFEFDPDSCSYPAISQIDPTHYLVAYKGSASDGWSVVLELIECPE